MTNPETGGVIHARIPEKVSDTGQRRAPGQGTLAAMKHTTTRQGVILDATVDGSVIRGGLIVPTGERRDFHGWLEFNTALEVVLGPDQPPVNRTGVTPP